MRRSWNRCAFEIIDTHTHFYDPTRPQGVPWPAKDNKLLRLPVPSVALPKPVGRRSHHQSLQQLTKDSLLLNASETLIQSLELEVEAMVIDAETV